MRPHIAWSNSRYKPCWCLWLSRQDRIDIKLPYFEAYTLEQLIEWYKTWRYHNERRATERPESPV